MSDCECQSLTAVPWSAGVNISGPCIAKIPPPLQIISLGSIDLKTVPAIHGKSLWRSRKVGEVGPRAPHPGPVYGVCTQSLGMCAHLLGGKRDYLCGWYMIRSSSPKPLKLVSRRPAIRLLLTDEHQMMRSQHRQPSRCACGAARSAIPRGSRA